MLVWLDGGEAQSPSIIKLWTNASSGEGHDPRSSFCDVTLHAGDGGPPLVGHKVILASASSYLAEVLRRSRAIRVRNIEHDTLSTILYYIYHGHVAVPKTSVGAILQAARTLGIASLVESIMTSGGSASLDEGHAPLRSPTSPRLTSVSATSTSSWNASDEDRLLEAIDEQYNAHIAAGALKPGERWYPDLKHIAALLSDDTKERTKSAIRSKIFRAYELQDARFTRFNIRDSTTPKMRAASAKRSRDATPAPEPFTASVPPHVPSTVYILGGLHNALSAERLCLATNAITPMPNVPQRKRSGLAVAVRGECIFACGGHLCDGQADAGPQGSQVVDTVSVFEMATGEWRSEPAAPPLATPRAYGTAVCLNGTVYVFGGAGPTGIRRLQSGEALSEVAASWAPVAPMLSRRAYFGTAAMEAKGSVFAVGGHDGESYLASAERYHALSNRWMPLPPMSCPRAYLAVQALGQRIYAIGGYDGKNRLSSVESYDVGSGLWSAVAAMHIPRAFLAAATSSDRMLVFGGSSAPGLSVASITVYDPQTDAWEDMAQPMAEARCFHGAVAA